MKKTYKVAGHFFSIEAKNGFPFWSIMKECYGVFEASNEEVNPRFVLTIDDSPIYCKEKRLIFSNEQDLKDGFISFSIFKTPDKTHYIELRQPSSHDTNAYMSLNPDFSKATLNLSGKLEEQWLTFNTAVSLCFHFSTSCQDTLLIHSSAVEYKGKAYLFLGKSGTGKSTHSRMWLNAINGVTLMNDDHPIIRVNNNGEIVAYGSPWSGKTRCYKNLQVPLGGIIRIIRAPYNKVTRLSIIQSYASIMTSCGGMTWEKDLADGRDQTLQKIISHIPCWKMECLPNEDAARVCSEAVTNV